MSKQVNFQSVTVDEENYFANEKKITIKITSAQYVSWQKLINNVVFFSAKYLITSTSKRIWVYTAVNSLLKQLARAFLRDGITIENYQPSDKVF